MKRTEGLLGIDLGSSSCKCVLVDAAGHRIAESVVEYTPTFVGSDGVEQEPESWWAAAAHGIRLALDRPEAQDVDVMAVGLTGQMRGLTLIGAEGLAVRPAILWNDRRCRRQVVAARELCADSLRRITRNPLNEMCTLPKLLWLRESEPESLDAAAKLIFPKDYLRYRLTGRLGTDVSDASGSSLFDLGSGEWSQELLELFSLPRELFPAVADSSEVVGSVTAAAAGETGLRAGTPVVAGASDATAEMAAIGIRNREQCKLRLGTSGALSTVSPDLEEVGDSLYVWSYLDRGHWMVDTNTRSCAQSVEWVRRLCYSESESAVDAYTAMEAEGRRSPAGAGGIVFHPYLLGEDAPYWNPDLKGSLFGMTAAHGRGDLVRAVLEGTAFALRDALSVFERSGFAFSEYFVVGGGAKFPLWVEIVAGVIGRELAIPSGSDAATGAAILAGMGTGSIEGERPPTGQLGRGGRAVSPSEVGRYDELFARYREIKRAYDRLY